MPTQHVHSESAPIARRRWRILGQVQGVGFRPFVYRLAAQLNLSGFVRNDPAGVIIEAQGPESRLDEFAALLVDEKPALAAIAGISCADIPVTSDNPKFEIEASTDSSAIAADVTVDTACCPDCIRELLDAKDRRFGYGLINCTNCGPRFSIIRRIPYDRPNTTMAGFAMCDACGAEFAEPANRRFHAQPIACHECGPKVTLVDSKGNLIAEDAISGAVQRLLDGKIVAIKGLGGFHLAVRADDTAAVNRLRELKHRDRKPFALMCANLEEMGKLVKLSEAARQAVLSPACPIVLAPRRAEANVADAVAPGNHRLGVMLPYTPIQHLLFAALRGGRSAQRPAESDAGIGSFGGRCADPTLVMTSANVSDEPLVTDNDEAVLRLGGMCDAILWHDRPIERPVDDSVVVDLGEDGLLPIRRARGYVPQAIALPRSRAGVPDLPWHTMFGLCVGGELKNTVAVVRGGSAILSHHLGDLTHAKAYACFRRAIADMCQLFAIRPQWIAHDLHPVYLSTSYARQLAAEMGVPLVGVQHHHAHAAAVMAENGVSEKVLAVVCDGVGYGADGTSWGGELLAADLSSFERLAHLRPMLLPGGDAAAKDCRRCGVALLHQAFGDGFAEHPAAGTLFPDSQERSVIATMLARRFNTAISSGAGRVFDGVAALLGVCSRNTYEAEAAMTLESLASEAPDVEDEENLFVLRGDGPVSIDLSPLILSLLEGMDSGAQRSSMAALFHRQFARAWEKIVIREAQRTGLNIVALSGGVFCNQILTQSLSRRLQSRGLRVLRHRLVPPNDGGLALGQAAIANSRCLCA
jgi:hydrogenase maturation protein HypF